MKTQPTENVVTCLNCGCFVFDAECKKCVQCGTERGENPAGAGGMSLEECRHEIAKGLGFKSWDDLARNNEICESDLWLQRERAAELYASQSFTQCGISPQLYRLIDRPLSIDSTGT